MEALDNHIEAIIFSADRPVKMKDIVEALGKSLEEKPSKKTIEKSLSALEEKYSSPLFSFGLVRISEGYQFLTKSDFHKTVSSYLNVKSKRRLSTAAMETLAIIAYKQPVTKSEMEQIRGVNCDYSVQRLLEKELIEIAGRSPGPGRPLLYATSQSFMDHFALGSIKDLPQLKEIVPEDNVIGVPELENDVEPEAASTDSEGETEALLNVEEVAHDETEVSEEVVEVSEEMVEASEQTMEVFADETEASEEVMEEVMEEVANETETSEETIEIVAEETELSEDMVEVVADEVETTEEVIEVSEKPVEETTAVVEDAIEENSLEFPAVTEAEEVSSIDSETVSEEIK